MGYGRIGLASILSQSGVGGLIMDERDASQFFLPADSFTQTRHKNVNRINQNINN